MVYFPDDLYFVGRRRRLRWTARAYQQTCQHITPTDRRQAGGIGRFGRHWALAIRHCEMRTSCQRGIGRRRDVLPHENASPSCVPAASSAISEETVRLSRQRGHRCTGRLPLCRTTKLRYDHRSSSFTQRLKPDPICSRLLVCSNRGRILPHKPCVDQTLHRDGQSSCATASSAICSPGGPA